MDISAILLAGGQASRMGYQDKAWVHYHGKPLIEHVIAAIRTQVSNIVISRNGDNDRYNQLGCRLVADTESLGPLSGIQACLEVVTSEHVLVVPCDIPNLPADLVTCLSSSLAGNDLVMARDIEQAQNLVFVAKRHCLGSIADFLAEGGRSVSAWIETLAYQSVDFEQPFHNINEVGQLQ